MEEDLDPAARRMSTRKRKPVKSYNEEERDLSAWGGRTDADIKKDIDFASLNRTAQAPGSLSPSYPRGMSRMPEDLPHYGSPPPLSRMGSPEPGMEPVPVKQEPESEGEDDPLVPDRGFSEMFPEPPGGFNERGFSETTQAIEDRFDLMHGIRRPLVPPKPPPIPSLQDAQTMLGQAIMEHREKRGSGILTTLMVAFAFLVAANYLD